MIINRKIRKSPHVLIWSTAMVSLLLSIISTTSASAAKARCSSKILTLPCWYRGLPADSKGLPMIKSIGNLAIVGVNILDMMLQIVGYIAVGFIIYGGIKLILSEGNSEKTAGARKTIINACVGLLIALASTAIINFVVRPL